MKEHAKTMDLNNHPCITTKIVWCYKSRAHPNVLPPYWQIGLIIPMIEWQHITAEFELRGR